MEEIWKDIPKYEGLYQVSNYGNVKSLSRKVLNKGGCYIINERILKPANSAHGYLKVILSKNSNKLQIHIHQLVAIAFLNHIPNGNKSKIVVDHIYNNRINNKLDNLQIISTRENNSKDRKNGSSKYIGVSFNNRTKKYVSAIRLDGKHIFLGYFDDEYYAHIAYQKALEMYNNGDLSFIKSRKKSSQYKGVYKVNVGIKWRAYIQINGVEKHLGYFNTELEAHNEVQKQKSLLL